MHPGNILFDDQRTNSGKYSSLWTSSASIFCGKSDYTMLICPPLLTTRTFTASQRERPTIVSYHLLKLVSMFFTRNQHSHSPGWLSSLKKSESAGWRACQAELFCSAHRHQRVGADPAFLTECGSNSFVLHAISQDHKGYFWRIHWWTYPRWPQRADFQVLPSGVLSLLSFSFNCFWIERKKSHTYAQWLTLWMLEAEWGPLKDMELLEPGPQIPALHEQLAIQAKPKKPWKHSWCMMRWSKYTCGWKD